MKPLYQLRFTILSIQCLFKKHHQHSISYEDKERIIHVPITM